MRYEVSNAKGKMRYEKLRAFFHGTGVNVRPVLKVHGEKFVTRQPVWLNVDRQVAERT